MGNKPKKTKTVTTYLIDERPVRVEGYTIREEPRMTKVEVLRGTTDKECAERYRLAQAEKLIRMARSKSASKKNSDLPRAPRNALAQMSRSLRKAIQPCLPKLAKEPPVGPDWNSMPWHD